MNVTIKEFGINELTARLHTSMKLPTFMKEFMTELSADMAVSVREKTPIGDTGDLAESIQAVVYDELAVITTPLSYTYGSYIETGARNDRRVRSGRVERRAGAALMFYRTAQEFKMLAGPAVQKLYDKIAAAFYG